MIEFNKEYVAEQQLGASECIRRISNAITSDKCKIQEHDRIEIKRIACRLEDDINEMLQWID